MENNEEDILPTPPAFTEEQLEQFRQTGDYRPALFEWYKFTGGLCAFVVHIQRNSSAFKIIPDNNYYILVGLLNRCARLMLSNIELSHQGRFGETTAIIDRCIFESAIKLIWLCTEPSPDKFSRFLADGLKTEVEFKKKINEIIQEGKRDPYPIESRMLGSIENHINGSGLTENEIIETLKLPDLASILTVIGKDRLIYIVGQKIGSHHVHGTWSSLLFHYLEEDPEHEFSFSPRIDHSPTHINQLMFIPLLVLDAMSKYVEHALETKESEVLMNLFTSTQEELSKIYSIAFGGDLNS